jgi:hypothetical protein
MPDHTLTPMQRSVLLILMAEARELPNADLTNVYGFKLEKGYRDRLERDDLIKVRKDERRRLFLELTEPGWRWCGDQDWSQVPAKSGPGLAAAYAILAGLQRNLPSIKLSTQELFARHDVSQREEPAPVGMVPLAEFPTDAEVQIRKAYGELATRPGDWVKLADLRQVVGELPRAQVDRVLVQLNRTPEVSIVPESNQKALSDRDRAAAVQIGNQDKHLIAIGPS